MKRRRIHITLLGGAAVALPGVAHGQQTPRTVPLVGALYIGAPSAPIGVSARDAFEQGLGESGYIDRQDIAIGTRYAKDPDEISKAVNDLVALRVDVIMTMGTPASLAEKRQSHRWLTGWWPVFPGRARFSDRN